MCKKKRVQRASVNICNSYFHIKWNKVSTHITKCKMIFENNISIKTILANLKMHLLCKLLHCYDSDKHASTSVVCIVRSNKKFRYLKHTLFFFLIIDNLYLAHKMQNILFCSQNLFNYLFKLFKNFHRILIATM